MDTMNFSFQAVKNIKLIRGTGKILSITDSYSPKDHAKIQGQLLTLFGEPIFNTPDLEYAYQYIIIATDSNKNEYVLSVYSGKSGPSIGGNKAPITLDAAKQLRDNIHQAETTDFEYEGYYIDEPTKITYKIENGRITCTEEKIKGEELKKAYKNLGINKI